MKGTGTRRIGEFEFLRVNPACWLLAVLMLALGAHAADTSSPSSGTVPKAQPAPKPAPANPKQLAAAFRKVSPDSITDLRSMEQQIRNLVAQVSPAVVAVEIGLHSGSGVVISEQGLVLTAGHVCGQPGRDVRFTFPDGRTANGRTLGVDHESDTGLMKITDPGLWPHAATGTLVSTHLGDWVLALGHPGGFDPRRSLVVRLGRIIRLAPEAIQTDCTISPGDSGGPLFDMYGRVIGIHSAISRSVAENFHVPITEFYETWDELVNSKNSESLLDHPRAYLGATAVDDAVGCRLSAVEESGPASRAGLKVGDLVVKVEDRDVKMAATLRRWVAEAEPGDTLSFRINRGDKLLSLDVKLRERPLGKR